MAADGGHRPPALQPLVKGRGAELDLEEVLPSSDSILKGKNKVCKILTLAAPICSFRNFSKGVMSTSLAFSIWGRKAKISSEV